MINAVRWNKMATMQSSGVLLSSIQVGVLTVSDTCHAGTCMDASGPNLCQLTQTLINNGVVAEQAVVPDEESAIKAKLLEWCDDKKLNIVFTTGGTGFAPRDITPEVTKSVIEREAPGLTIAMIKASLDVTPMAMLSRLTCGIRGSTVIINLPGSKKGSEECFRFVLPALPHAVGLLRGDKKEVTSTHKQVQALPDLSKTTQTSETSGTDRHGCGLSVNDVASSSWKEHDNRQNHGRRRKTTDASSSGSSANKRQLREKLLGSDQHKENTLFQESIQTVVERDKVIAPQGRAMPRTRAQRKLYSVAHSLTSDVVLSETSQIHHSDLECDKNICNNVKETGVASVSEPSRPSVVTTYIDSIKTPTEHLEDAEKEFIVQNDTEDTELYCDMDVEDNVEPADDVNKTIKETDAGDIENHQIPSEAVISAEGMVVPYGECAKNERVVHQVIVASSAEMAIKVNDKRECQETIGHIQEGNESEYAQILCEMSKSSNTGQQQTSAACDNTMAYENVKQDSVQDGNESDKYDNSVDEGSEQKNSQKAKRTFRILSTKPKRHSKDAEVNFAQVGKSAKIWCQNHPLINGIYLNKGKREVKRNLVILRRQPTAVDKGSYLRNGYINDKNRIDDYFEFTEEGKKRREQFEQGLARDEYVVNWYMWCPGHGNCLRKCGGYGKCIQDCPGSKHKQDRHNCSLMLTWKLYLSDLDKWRIQITGSHVPVDSNVRWTLPAGKERLDEDTRDIILEYSSRHCLQSVTIKKLIEQRRKSVGGVVPSCNRINRFVENKRKRQSLRDQDVRSTLEKSQLDGDVSDGANVVGKEEEVEVDPRNLEISLVQVSMAGTSAGPIADGAQAGNHGVMGGNSSGYIVTYYDGTPVSAVFGSATDFLQNSMQTMGAGQNISSAFNIQKQDDQVADTIIDQSGLGHMANQCQVTFTSNGAVCSLGGEDMGVMSLPGGHVSQGGHVTQDMVSAQQHVHLVPQHVPSSLQTSVAGRVPIVALDAEGMPCYGNFGDLSSFFVTCQQSQNQTQ